MEIGTYTLELMSSKWNSRLSKIFAVDDYDGVIIIENVGQIKSNYDCIYGGVLKKFPCF